MKASNVLAALIAQADPARAKSSEWFFKAGPGEYGEGDEFLGIPVPAQRKIAKQFAELPLEDIRELLFNSKHEARLTALFILVLQFKKASPIEQKDLYNFYLRHTNRINNWDLVDSSAHHIVGGYLVDKDRKVLRELAQSQSLWERRIAIIATAKFISLGQSKDTFDIATILLHDKHDLIHKAVGWMLREVGKNCGEDTEEEFLKQHYKVMPRTMLRYAIERFDEPLRQRYLRGEV